MQGQVRLSKVLYALYGAATDPAGWRPVAGLLAQLHGGHSARIAVRDRFGGPGFPLTETDNLLCPELVHRYNSSGYQKNVWVDAVQAKPGVVIGSELLPDSEFQRTDYYNETCKPAGVFYAIGSAIRLSTLGDVAFVSVHRDRRYGYFERRPKQQMELLMPHLTQALQLRAKLMQLHVERYASLAALEALALGALVVDQGGYLLFANSVAESLLRSQGDLIVRHGRLLLKDTAHHAALSEAIRFTAFLGVGVGHDAHVNTLFGVPRTGPRCLSLRVYPVPEPAFRTDVTGPAALIFLSNARVEALSLGERLTCLYGLTSAEARLGEAVAAGQSLGEFCSTTQVSINTAKTHLKRIFAKTGHRRQSQFVRDVIGNPVLHMNLPSCHLFG